MVEPLLRAQLADPAAGWSVGSWGAVADLELADDQHRRVRGLAAWAPQAGVRIQPVDELRIVAYERCLRAPGTWRQALALCLPAARARMRARGRVTALGPDRGALRPEDRACALFDLGVGTPWADFCVRTADPTVSGILHRAEGTSVWDRDPGVRELLITSSPARVVLTAAVRAEVSTPIPAPGDVTPAGPHTHLLPKLLATGRAHAAIDPIPAGLVPVATIFPAHPIFGPGGVPIPFDLDRHVAFQRLLRVYGDALHVATKDEVAAAVMAGTAPEPRPTGPGSVARTRAVRVALRQLARTDPSAPGLRAWQEQFGEPL